MTIGPSKQMFIQNMSEAATCEAAKLLHFWRAEAERMEKQLCNQRMQWEEKEQGLVSEIYLRDSELTALEHQVKEAAKSVEVLQSAKRDAEEKALQQGIRVQLLEAQLAHASYLESVGTLASLLRADSSEGGSDIWRSKAFSKERSPSHEHEQCVHRPWVYCALPTSPPQDFTSKHSTSKVV
jgi:hypothetical protein